MVGVALSWLRQKCAGKRISTRYQRLTPRSPLHPHAVSRVGGWRASFRVRWFVRRFRAGPQSGSRGRVSRPPLTEPGVPISGTGLSSGIMRLAHGPPGQGRDRAGEPADRGRCTTAILPPASSPMRRRACSRLDDIEPIEFDPFASACDALRTLGHQGGVLGRATPRRLSSFPHPSAPEAPSLPPALPGFRGIAGLSATLPARPAPRGVPVGACPPPTGLPVLPPSLSSMRAAVITPAEPTGARVARFPAGGSLPRYSGGSASALPVSRPARRSLVLRPTWSLSRPGRPVAPECFSRSRYLLQPLRLLPAGATLAGRDSHPLRESAFPRRTE